MRPIFYMANDLFTEYTYLCIKVYIAYKSPYFIYFRQVLTILILPFFSGGREGIFGGTRVEVRRSLQNTLRRCFGTARGVTSARNKRFRQNSQHSAHHQSFTAHLRAREILGKQNPSYSLLFATLAHSRQFSFYCFRGQHNAVKAWHTVYSGLCLSPRFLLITLHPTLGQIAIEGTEFAWGTRSVWFDTSVCAFFWWIDRILLRGKLSEKDVDKIANR